MSEVYLEISQEYDKDFKIVTEQIRIFEEIYKNKKQKPETKELAKQILIKLYKEKDKYARQSKFYRTLHQKSQIGK